MLQILSMEVRHGSLYTARHERRTVPAAVEQATYEYAAAVAHSLVSRLSIY